MICINPTAPLDERARAFAALSMCITARIQFSGTLKRLDASVTNAAKGWRDWLLARCDGCDACLASAALLNIIDDANIVTKHSILPRDRKAAIMAFRRSKAVPPFR